MGSCEDEVESKIGSTCRTIGALREKAVDRKELSKTSKLRAYNAIYRKVYTTPSSETWTLQNRHMKKLQATEMRHPTKVEGVMIMDSISSDYIRRRLKQEDALEIVLRWTKNWPRKIEEMPEERRAKISVHGGDARKESKKETVEKMGR